MRLFLLLSGWCLFLSGCAALSEYPGQNTATPDASCEGSDVVACRFVNSPVQLDESNPVRISDRDVDFFPTVERLDFVDGSGKTWIAHKGIVTDGASIPKIFISIVGEPRSPEFVNAAAVHDAYCGAGNESAPRFHKDSWQRVHVMFYDALRAGGTPEIKAKIMFAAVYLGGPRWGRGTHSSPIALPLNLTRAVPIPASFQVIKPSVPALISYKTRYLSASNLARVSPSAKSFLQTSSALAPELIDYNPRNVPSATLRQAMRTTKRFIQANNPSIPELIAFMTQLEQKIAAEGLAAPANPGPVSKPKPGPKATPDSEPESSRGD